MRGSLRWGLRLALMLGVAEYAVPAHADYTYTQHREVVFSQAGGNATGTGTTEQTLGTYSLRANAMPTAGNRVFARAMFTFAANTHNRTGKLYFGSAVISTGTDAASGGTAWLELEIVKTGAATQIVWGRGATEGGVVVPYEAAGTEDDTAAIVVKATCTDGTSAASDCVLADFVVERSF